PSRRPARFPRARPTRRGFDCSTAFRSGSGGSLAVRDRADASWRIHHFVAVLDLLLQFRRGRRRELVGPRPVRRALPNAGLDALLGELAPGLLDQPGERPGRVRKSIVEIGLTEPNQRNERRLV